MTTNPLNIKCVVVGDGAVGKTSLLIVYTSGKFPEDYVPTIFENETLNVTVDDTSINIDFSDTADQVDYHKLRLMAYTDANILLLCFSVVNPNSFQNIKKIGYVKFSLFLKIYRLFLLEQNLI